MQGASVHCDCLQQLHPPSSILQPSDGAMSTGASPSQGGASPPRQGSPGGVITVVKSTARQVDVVEQQLQALASALTHGGGAQAATLRHLELFEAAVQGLKVGSGAQLRAYDQAVCTRSGAGSLAAHPVLTVPPVARRSRRRTQWPGATSCCWLPSGWPWSCGGWI